MKRLLPSLHEKRRYIVFFIQENKEKAKKTIEEALLNWLGILSYSKAGPQIVELKPSKEGCYGILNVEHLFVDNVKAALALLSKVECIGISGTIKKAKEKFLKGKI
jgi:RNase P/RNase MRP subunit POP5